MENKSLYDPTRKTVGAIYREAQINHDGTKIEVGAMANELISSLITDLNDTIKSNPHDDRPFYITIHESKDLKMPNMIRRRMLTSVYRPYPEDDTVVFWVHPKTCEVKFCWCLPHWSEMDNMIANDWMWEKEMIDEIRAWKRVDLHHFGFRKCEMGNWIPNEHWVDKSMHSENVQILTV